MVSLVQISPAEWENCGHEKGDMWSIQLIKDNLEEQRINLDMIPQFVAEQKHNSVHIVKILR